MGYIKEPEGIDFVIKSKALTDKDRQEISAFIRAYKEKEIKEKSTRPVRVRSKADKA
ncbi:hypothetical protein [Persicitalea jodogahamensis]|uniref:Uncharacterized protein n=1 Tax=Persicitalea jodogahamensis TaxID=402147 RepID=A0A8J3D718_9BACT|nr:hypothetical protein [Persicitalea jodogahamensis]GHB59831.1 hypothetical protein GCM10007390_11930 [Persicitalea jodogahamensis]